VERACELIRPYEALPGVRGVYLVGSATRPWRDATSDYDFEVAMEDDAYEALPLEKRHKFQIDPGPPPRVDHEFYCRPWSELSALPASVRDLDHFPYQFARVLFDPDGDVAELLARAAAMPAEVRSVRMRVHFLEFAFGAARARKCLARGDDFNTRLVVDGCIVGLGKLLFVTCGRWPALRHWWRQELYDCGVSGELVTGMERVLAECRRQDVEALVVLVEEWLAERGESFQTDRVPLREWAFLSDEGKAAFRTWGSS
jgi:hypothetical protein